MSGVEKGKESMAGGVQYTDVRRIFAKDSQLEQ